MYKFHNNIIMVPFSLNEACHVNDNNIEEDNDNVKG